MKSCKHVYIMKNAVFWDVGPCSSCVNRRFGGKYRPHLHGASSQKTAFFKVTAVKTYIVFFYGEATHRHIRFTLKMEAIRSSETSVLTISTRRHIPEDVILHSHRCENLKSYMCSLASTCLSDQKRQNFYSMRIL
jgi:hypothetical protein